MYKKFHFVFMKFFLPITRMDMDHPLSRVFSIKW